jgi:histidine ammonia-lyase
LRLEPKDGLALISANGVAIGHAALVVERAGRTAP